MTTSHSLHSHNRTFAAKLLYQFRHKVERRSDKRRLCEVRIVRFEAESSREALATAKRRGMSAEHSYRNVSGEMVHFEFVGILDLLNRGSECEKDEVWWEWTLRLSPMERKEKLIPSDRKLLSLFPKPPRRRAGK
jgi:uncharacterized protein DUF4288